MPATTSVEAQTTGLTGWRRSIAQYRDRRVLLILPLGFASGFPLLLTFSTLSAGFAKAGVSRGAIGAFGLVGSLREEGGAAQGRHARFHLRTRADDTTRGTAAYCIARI